jgi:hypothetical protein
MYLWAIYIIPGSVCLFGYRKMGRPILGIFKSFTIHECGNWEKGHYNSVLEITRPYSFISRNTSIGTRHLYWILTGTSFTVKSVTMQSKLLRHRSLVTLYLSPKSRLRNGSGGEDLSSPWQTAQYTGVKIFCKDFAKICFFFQLTIL